MARLLESMGVDRVVAVDLDGLTALLAGIAQHRDSDIVAGNHTVARGARQPAQQQGQAEA